MLINFTDQGQCWLIKRSTFQMNHQTAVHSNLFAMLISLTKWRWENSSHWRCHRTYFCQVDGLSVNYNIYFWNSRKMDQKSRILIVRWRFLPLRASHNRERAIAAFSTLFFSNVANLKAGTTIIVLENRCLKKNSSKNWALTNQH